MDTSLVLTFISGGLVVAIFNHYAGKRRELELQQRERKEQQYNKFLENLIGFFEGWPEKRKKIFMEELYTHAPLYASSEVIKLANKFLACFDEDENSQKQSDSYYKELLLAMRKDLGSFKNDKLEVEDINIRKLNK